MYSRIPSSKQDSRVYSSKESRNIVANFGYRENKALSPQDRAELCNPLLTFCRYLTQQVRLSNFPSLQSGHSPRTVLPLSVGTVAAQPLLSDDPLTPERGELQEWRSPVVARGALVGGGFQDGGVALVAGDDAVELFEVVDFGDGDAEFLDFDGAGVAEDVALYLGFAVIAGEAVVGIGGRRKVVHLIAGRQGDFVDINVFLRTVELDGIFAGFLALENVAGLIAEDARADDEKIAGGLGIAIGGEGIVVDEGLILRLKIADGGLGDLK